MQTDIATSKLVLQHLLDQLRDPTNRHHGRYKDLVTSTASNEVEEVLVSCMHPQFLALVDEGRLDSFVDSKSIPSDTSYRGRAIYLHIVNSKDSIARYYIGQAYNLSWRIRQHLDFRYRRDNPSLHYWAVNSSTADSFVVLGKLEKKVEYPELVLNVLEMWAALLLQSLVPKSKLDDWLPAHVPRLDLNGLNVELPLDQGAESDSHAAFESLKSAEDKLVRDYYLYYTDRHQFRESKRQGRERRERSAGIVEEPKHSRQPQGSESVLSPPNTAAAIGGRAADEPSGGHAPSSILFGGELGAEADVWPHEQGQTTTRGEQSIPPARNAPASGVGLSTDQARVLVARQVNIYADRANIRTSRNVRRVRHESRMRGKQPESSQEERSSWWQSHRTLLVGGSIILFLMILSNSKDTPLQRPFLKLRK
ncbi:hypothetical protein NA57DRAFT_71432 [Rhizodiscina lignyota]|uniref:GIY-YIG domain-containing protein n=1 Tax=Rhizodiscina lignyota TaxID=1504668 RepID=A0A9P4INF4_9PEZI|nr:hypothetical protein NA57DRAFT_71432 [Rhizodiscina lignyota]